MALMETNRLRVDEAIRAYRRIRIEILRSKMINDKGEFTLLMNYVGKKRFDRRISDDKRYTLKTIYWAMENAWKEFGNI